MNLQGDVTAILDANGETVATYWYSAWGTCAEYDANGEYLDDMGTHIAQLNPFRYRSYFFDQETGLYYLNTRYYDHDTGRFLNADGMVSTGIGFDGNNMFAYCNNNPVMLSDPNGTCPGTHEHIKRVCAQLETCEVSHTMLDSFQAKTKEVLISNIIDTTSDVSDVVLGATSHILNHQTKNIDMYLKSDNYIQLLPLGGMDVERFPNTVNALNKASTVLTVGSLAWDISNTWMDDSDNTTKQRCIKTGVQLGGVVAGILVGSLAVSVSNFWNPVGWVGMVGVAVTYATVSIGGSMMIGAAEEWIYDKFDIE